MGHQRPQQRGWVKFREYPGVSFPGDLQDGNERLHGSTACSSPWLFGFFGLEDVFLSKCFPLAEKSPLTLSAWNAS